MRQETELILQFADHMPGGRAAFLADLSARLHASKFYSSADLSRRYDVALNTIKYWRRTGKLVPSFKMANGTVRYSESDIQKFEDTMKANARAENNDNTVGA